MKRKIKKNIPHKKWGYLLSAEEYDAYEAVNRRVSRIHGESFSLRIVLVQPQVVGQEDIREKHYRLVMVP